MMDNEQFTTTIDEELDRIKNDPVCQQQLHEWARHYDTLLWNVVAISTAGVGAAAAFCYSKEKPGLWPELAGMFLSLLGLVYAASFRSFRRNLETGMSVDMVRFQRNPNPRHKWMMHQWNMMVLSFGVFDWFLVYKLAKEIGCFSNVLFSVLTIVLCFGLCILWKEGNGQRP